jgi:hypothetical protein
MSQEAPLRIVKHARRHHRSRYPSGQPKPRFRVGQTIKFRARTHHGEPVSFGRVRAVHGQYGEQPSYSIKLPNGVTVLAYQESLTAYPRSGASRGRDKGPIRASRTFGTLADAGRFLRKILKKHPEARIESRHPTASLRRTEYRVVWKTRSTRDPERHRHRTPGAPSFAKQKLISRKIRLLRREGYEPKQAQAIAYRMYGASRER